MKRCDTTLTDTNRPLHHRRRRAWSTGLTVALLMAAVADVAAHPRADGLAGYVSGTRVTAVRQIALEPPARSVGEPGDTLAIDSGLVEPAVPLNLSLKVRILDAEPLIEITVVIGKRSGFPAQLFFDSNVTARVTLPPGLELSGGSLTWAGDLKGDQEVVFVATVKAIHDMDGVVEASAIGYAEGGRVDADRERFRVVVRGGRPRVSLAP